MTPEETNARRRYARSMVTAAVNGDVDLIVQLAGDDDEPAMTSIALAYITHHVLLALTADVGADAADVWARTCALVEAVEL